MRKYQQCKNCVMDTTDIEIVFDAKGVCNHCNNFKELAGRYWFPNQEGGKILLRLIKQIKSDGNNKQYDCIIGLSGGVDSSYLALKIKEFGLRPLVVHVDAGWNSELAVSNIQKIVSYCNYDLHTHVVDWEEMKDLHIAYLKSGVSNQDVPQDHVFFASLYHFAASNKIKYILSGGNIATEGIFPSSWHGNAMDSINLKAIHKQFGSNKLKNYNTINFFDYYIWYPFVLKMKTIRPLNYMQYNKSNALAELESVIGYKPYARKHGESLFTKFFQNYYLPKRFNFDKRKPHLSSLIVSGQLTREEALQRLVEPLYESRELESDVSYFCKKLQISREQFEDLMNAPIKQHSEFKNWDIYYRLLKKIKSPVEKIMNRQINIYS